MSEDQVPDSKTAGATIYLVEELSDARLRCDQLIRYVGEATRLVEASPQREVIFEAAGHLIYSIPHVVFRLQKALQAAALATNKLDSEEIKSDLRPEKVKQLEDVLQDVRIRQVQRHSEPIMTNKWKVDAPVPHTAAADEYPKLNKLAKSIALALDTVAKDGEALVAEWGKTDGEGMRTVMSIADVKGLVKMAKKARHDNFGWGSLSFTKNASGVSEKTAADVNVALVERMITTTEKELKQLKSSLAKYKGNPDKYKGQLDNVQSSVSSIWKMSRLVLKSVFDVKVASDDDDDKQSRFEEGKPADPTKNMSPEDAEKWKNEKERNKDKFKAAKSDSWKATS